METLVDRTRCVGGTVCEAANVQNGMEMNFTAEDDDFTTGHKRKGNN